MGAARNRWDHRMKPLSSARMRHWLGASAILVAAIATALPAQAGSVLDAINQRGKIKVGVGTSPGFFAPDSNGKWQGFFVDFGHALAVTVFNDPAKVDFTSSSPQQRLPALQAGEFDILLSGVTETITRAFKLGFHFGPVIFYDGQGLLVKKSLGVTKGADLDGATIAIQAGTTGELNIADFFRKSGKTFKSVVIEDSREFRNALNSGRVDALTQDSSDLAIQRTQLARPDDYVLLPERLSKDLWRRQFGGVTTGGSDPAHRPSRSDRGEQMTARPGRFPPCTPKRTGSAPPGRGEICRCWRRAAASAETAASPYRGSR